MKSTELKIGNWVLWRGPIHPEKALVSAISEHEVYFSCGDSGLINEIEGLPLTTWWLERVGFKPFQKDWVKKSLIVHTRKRGFVIRKSIPIIESVHQLQNLYFALTGEELEIKK